MGGTDADRSGKVVFAIRTSNGRSPVSIHRKVNWMPISFGRGTWQLWVSADKVLEQSDAPGKRPIAFRGIAIVWPVAGTDGQCCQ